MVQRPPCVVGCDTFVAFPPTAPEGSVIFGKNSDRPTGEKQSVRHYPRKTHQDHILKCTYISIPQHVQPTHAVLLSQIDWMWGAEMGANEHGVVIGNEAVWTVEPIEESPSALLGMDLVRLGLERGATAEEALNTITTLLEKYGQGGPCAENDPSFTYHNSFLIANAKEAWVLETAGKHWAAERVTSGGRNISNGLTIRTEFHRSSKGLKEFARKKGYWNGVEPFDFAACFSEGGDSTVEALAGSRQVCGTALLKQHGFKGTLDAKAMMEILKDHKGGICMHGGGFETTASMVSELNAEKTSNTEGDKTGPTNRHWMTGRSHPCKSPFVERLVES